MVDGTSEQEFLKIYQAHSDAIFRYCLVRVRNRESALDITQEVFLRTWRYLAKGERVRSFVPFLYQVARNTLVTVVSQRQPSSLDELLEQGIEPVQQERLTAEARLAFKEALDQLARLEEKYREPVTLRYIDGLGVQEIAGMLKLSENVVSVRIHRGLKQLRSFMA